MPTYDYQCDDCGRTYEVRQRISEAPLTTCQYCGGCIHRLLSAAPFILKGGGWYVTDYPSESRKKAVEAEKKAAPAETAGTSKGTETAKGTDGSTGSGSTSGESKPASSPPAAKD